MRRMVLPLSILIALAAPAHAKVSWKKTTKPYPGVVVREGRTGDNKNNVFASTVSLCTSHVHVTATAPPSGTSTPGSWAGKVGVQLAVNGDFYTWACGKPQIYGDAVGGSKRWPACQRGNDASHAGECGTTARTGGSPSARAGWSSPAPSASRAASWAATAGIRRA